MKLTKNLTLAALLASTLLTVGTAVRAQDATTPPANPPAAAGGGQMHKPNIDYLAKQLDLTNDQKTKFSAALDEQRQKLKALMSDKSLSQEDRRSQVKQLREGLNTELKGILTGEQFAKWEKISTHHRNSNRPAVPTIGSTNAPTASN
jgi:protein CpxP